MNSEKQHMTGDVLHLVHVMHKLRKTLQREQRGYQRALFTRLGLPEGLSESEFAFCVKTLENQRWLTVDKGGLGRPILIFNKDHSEPRYSPEEVIAHAMQCPPITEEQLKGPSK